MPEKSADVGSNSTSICLISSVALGNMLNHIKSQLSYCSNGRYYLMITSRDFHKIKTLILKGFQQLLTLYILFGAYDENDLRLLNIL